MSDFWCAARRHHEDATLLCRKQRWSNASHLAGLAGECALKHALERLGVLRLDPGGRPKCRDLASHIDRLKGTALRNWQGLGSTQLYELVRGPGFFEGWAIADRYEKEPADESRARGHLSDAANLLRLVGEIDP